MKNIIISIAFILASTLIGNAQTSNWVFTGPSDFPTNISGQIHGIGRVCQVKFDPNDNNTMYACSASGGLWKSVNAANSWVQLGTDVLPKMGIASVCIDHTNSNIIYIGSGDPNYYGNDFGIWKTTNGGINWVQANTGMGNLMAVELLMDSIDNLTLLAATSDGIYKTIDGGLNWTLKLAGNQFTDMVRKPGSGSNILYASSMDKFFRSNDNGDNWIEITSGFAGYLGSGTRIAVSQNNPAIVYVGTVNGEGIIFRSIDSGLNFSIRYNNSTWSLTGYDSTGGGQGNYNFCVEANPSNADQLFLGSHNIMRSNDGGLTWQKLTNWWQTVHTDMHDYIFQPGNNSNLFQANDGGVWLTSNSGVAWTPKSDGLGATENYHAATSPLYAGLISTGTQDNGELVYINGIWKTNRGGDWTTRMQMDYSTQKFVYYFDDFERRALPSGGGDEYGVPSAIASTSIKHLFSSDNQNLGFVSGGGIWRTNNLTQPSPIWTQIVTATSTVRAMATCKSHPNIMAYCASNKFYVSHNALSATPTFVMSNIPFTISNADIVISPVDTNVIFAALNTTIYKSIDGGLTFTNYSGTLTPANTLKLILDDYSKNNSLYMGNASGVYYRNDTMSDWVNYSGVLPTIASIKDVMCFNDGGVDARIYVSYYGRGTWETTLENTNTCSTPTLSPVTFVGANATTTWNNTGAISYEVQYRELGSVVWSALNSTTTSVSISNYIGCSNYEMRVRSKCGTDTSLWSNRVYFNTPSNPLNNDFDNHNDIGPVGAAGSVCYDGANQRYTVFASGADIWDKKDQFHFLYKKLQGDITISARVKHIGNIYGWAKAGVMIRETLNEDSKHSMCALTPGNGFANQWRTNTNDWSDNIDTAGNEPGWVMLERIGNSFTAYFSTDGINWETLNTATITMTDTVYVGLANCSHIDSTLNDAVFDNIVINGVALHTPQEIKNDMPFTLFPNPAQNELTIDFSADLSRMKLKIAILDTKGNVVMNSKKEGSSNTHRIDISSLSKGVYFLEVQSKSRYVMTFVKY